MITTLLVKCPHCNQVSQIYLSTSVSVIILNCPSCSSPIMYFGRKIFLLDKDQLRKITGQKKLPDKLSLAEERENIRSLCPAKKTAQHFENADAGLETCEQGGVDHAEEKYITSDDCTNLLIELQLCCDTKDFINHI